MINQMNQQVTNLEKAKIFEWINDLNDSSKREEALSELSRNRELVPDLAPMLWHSFGTISILLQEITNVYPAIVPPTLTAHLSNRVCNALALLQCVASHNETRTFFLQTQIPLYLYPFLQTTSKQRPFEYLRLTSLGVIGALVRNDEQDAIKFMLATDFIPLFLKIMESGSELSKTVATFILQKILTFEIGLNYICNNYERFHLVVKILTLMVANLVKEPSARLLKHVIRCYLRLTDNPRAKDTIRIYLPEELKNSTFANFLKDDQSTKKWLAQLLKNLETNNQPNLNPNSQTPLNNISNLNNLFVYQQQQQQQIQAQQLQQQQQYQAPNLISPAALNQFVEQFNFVKMS